MYIDNNKFDEICEQYPGLADYVEGIIRAREQIAYREGYQDGYNDGSRLPQPPYYDDDDEFVLARGGAF